MEFVSSYAVEHMRIEEAHGMEFILRTPEYDTVQHDLSVRAADNGVSFALVFSKSPAPILRCCQVQLQIVLIHRQTTGRWYDYRLPVFCLLHRHKPISPVPPLITGCVYTYHQISYRIDFNAAELAGKSIA